MNRRSLSVRWAPLGADVLGEGVVHHAVLLRELEVLQRQHLFQRRPRLRRELAGRLQLLRRPPAKSCASSGYSSSLLTSNMMPARDRP